MYSYEHRNKGFLPVVALWARPPRARCGDGTPETESGADRQASSAYYVVARYYLHNVMAYIYSNAPRLDYLAMTGLYRSKSNNYNELESPRRLGREFHHLASGGMRKA
jgi:hypothetical protein